jgi:glycine/D-amino acid oxidase-like deaminating enzyme
MNNKSNQAGNAVWKLTAPQDQSWPGLRDEVRVDVAVVGAGFCGLSAALHLAQSGASVALLEQHSPGWGASGRNRGQVIPGLKLDPNELLSLMGEETGENLISSVGSAPDLVFNLIQRFDIQCDAQRSGWIQLATGKRGLAQIESRVNQWQSRQVNIELLAEKQIGELTGAQGYVGGLIDRRGGNLNPLAYARGLARAATENNVSIFANSPMLSLTRENGLWQIKSTLGMLNPDKVLICTNAYTDKSWPGLKKTIIPFVSGAIATEPLLNDLRATILPHAQAAADNSRLLSWFGFDRDGRFIFGGRTGKWSETADPKDFKNRVSRMHEVFPQLENIDIEHYWSGKVALTADHLPHVHELAHGVYAGLGFNGRGVAMATLMGKILSQYCLKGADAEPIFPISSCKTIPFHSIRRPVVQSVVWWKKFMDRFFS